MFTGIISHLGKLTKAENPVFTFSAPKTFCASLKKGTSIAVNGTCLTVTSKPRSNAFSVEIIPETLKRTMPGKLKVDDLVNLELPVTANTLLSGHIVQGHVDGTGKVEEIKKEGNSRLFTIKIPSRLSKYIVEKGSIAVNGVSLTVIDIGDNFFTVGIIPHTWDKTMLYTIKSGDYVNIEVDILAKYLEKLIIERSK
ncbi:riboflavin synthase subunit alpha [Candidatus Gottesmanbacteria bacterium RIFCSPHIGHO2_02_FULL_40_13]|uniref:Riboflavin synthase n=1 Tax=Candidatus Gottesmanbacteria bacterium RIFCSPHIGHO2_02_FULL_40_13 TaxID=1798384 RepID=A0A1F6A7T7_9BACT|nr:MAG: riboflavin synthase subunit alpha [Candidatus Gottesmanbacteria bacterium RIFCSPHIGHO2_02_FULL_40_13]